MASDDLRARLAEALNVTPAGFLRDHPDSLAFHKAGLGEDVLSSRHDRHNYLATCALCRGEADTLADAVLAIVQPELERLRTACRSAAVLLRAVADRGANVDTLLDAAQDLDEIADPDRAQRPHMTASDTVGGFWPDMTGGRCSPCHLAALRGYEPEPDCPDCNTTAKENLS